MGTNYIAPIWRMPRNFNKDKLSNYSLEFGPATADVISTNTTWQTDVGLDNVRKVSFSAWVNPNSGTGSSIMAVTSQAYGSWNGNFNITYRANITTLALEFRGAGGIFINSSTTLAGDTWHHICFVLDLTLGGTIAQEVRCFVNNSEVSNQSSANPPLNFVLKTTTFNIGRTLWGETTPNGSGYQWQGKIAQACFFNYALSTDQINYLYNLNNPMAISGAEPVAYWPLGDNSNPNANAGYPNISVGADSVFQLPGGNTYPNTITFGTGTTEELQITDKITASIWIKTTDTAYSGLPAEPFLSRNMYSEGWYLSRRYQTAADKRLRLVLYNTNGASNTLDVNNWDTLIADGKWHHIAFTYDGTSNAGGLKIYVDGEFKEEMATSSTGIKDTIGSAWETLQLGHRQYLYETIDGEYSNLSIFNTDLPATGTQSIKSLYGNGAPPEIGNYSNLVGWWKLNQSANWEADSTGNWQIPDNRSAYPQSFDFDSTINEYIRAPKQSFFDTGNKSVSVWVKPQSPHVGYVYDCRGTSTGAGFTLIGTNTAGIFRLYVQMNTLTKRIFTGYQPSLDIQYDKWTNVAWTFDESAETLKVYINGVFKYTLTTTATGTFNPANPLEIGRAYNVNGNDFDGNISNLMIWDEKLTDGNVSLNDTATGQIAEVYNNGVPLTTAIASNNLKAWYKLDNTEKYLQTYLNARDNWVIKNNFQDVNYNSALYMDGTNSNRVQVNSSSNLEITGSHSFSLWIFYDDYSATSYIFDKGGLDYAFQIAGVSPRIIYYGYTKSGGGTGNHITQLPGNFQSIDNTWHHVVITTDITAKTIRYYLDGEEQGTGFALPSDFEALRTSNGKLTIMSYEGGTYASRGLISNFAIYNGSVLQPSEVTALYNNSTPEVTPSITPTSWWKLNNLTTGLIDNINGDNATNIGSTVKEIPVQVTAGISSGMTEQNLVNNSVSSLNGESGGINTTNLVTSNISRTQPYSNYSFNFDAATSDYISIPNPGSIFSYGESAFTFSGWVSIDAYSDQDGIFGRFDNAADRALIKLTFTSPFNGLMFQTVENNVNAYLVWNGILPNPANGEWKHICLTYDAGNVELYLDGVDQGAGTPTGTIPATMPNLGTSTQLEIARDQTNFAARLLNGRTSNFCVFDRALTESEILKIYNNGVPQDLKATSSFSNNILGWWPMDQRSSYYDGNDWVVRDLEGGKDGSGINTGNVEDMVGNAPGSEASGTGNNLTIADLKGNMYNSDKNAYSINMADYADGVTNPANSGRSTDTP